jgi:hypothetical protein
MGANLYSWRGPQAVYQRLARDRRGPATSSRLLSCMRCLDYMAYYRNREAFQLFQEHSTHLRKEREQAQAKRQATSRGRAHPLLVVSATDYECGDRNGRQLLGQHRHVTQGRSFVDERVRNVFECRPEGCLCLMTFQGKRGSPRFPELRVRPPSCAARATRNASGRPAVSPERNCSNCFITL